MSAYGLSRVVEPRGVLPQQAQVLDADPRPRTDEVLIDVERLNLDAASFRQLREAHGSPDAVRAAVLEIVGRRGKMQNPVTGSGGMLLGRVREVGPDSALGLKPGDRVATLVSLTLTPLRISDELRDWDGRSEQVPCQGTAILFGRSIAAVLPGDLPEELSLSVLDVCGAPALTARVVARKATELGRSVHVAVLGAAGKSGSLSMAAAVEAGAATVTALVPTEAEAAAAKQLKLADRVVIADARNPLAVAKAVGDQVDVTVVCVDVPGCEHGAVLVTADGGTVIFFSMATSFAAAALGAEGLAADVEMLIGNGYVPGHADYALDLIRRHKAVRALFSERHRQTARL
ncbi:L-erythro-3,5-diaminohexanoate dehydrogenase [Pseudonocardiaceae bacterium YIM PH 21723]|nr:L-erythro-3,5-diaminohexanoate dehydrogenase [Pseudonocardiaceae bacterium YIM PH 21723]